MRSVHKKSKMFRKKWDLRKLKKKGESKCDVSYASGALDKQMRL
jgi:hypothetical protein